MQEGLDRAVRTTNQMLALARAKDASLAEGGFAPSRSTGRHGGRRHPRPAAGGPYPPAGRGHGHAVWTGQGAGGRLAAAGGGQQRWTTPSVTAQGGDLTVRVLVGDGRLVVEDSGPGMSAEDIARACVRFRRGAAGRNKPGAGLGRPSSAPSPRSWARSWSWRTGRRSPACARRWCLPWKTPRMLRCVTKITEFERCWKGSILYGCVRGASRAAHGTACKAGMGPRPINFGDATMQTSLKLRRRRHGGGRPDPVAGRRPGRRRTPPSGVHRPAQPGGGFDLTCRRPPRA